MALLDFLFLRHWNASEHTDDDNTHWAWLRGMEWEDFPAFLAPLYGPIVVLLYGWIPFLVLLFVLELIWKLLFESKFISIGLSSVSSRLVWFAKWPLALGFAIVSYLSGHSPWFTLSVAIFPILSYLAIFVKFPLMPLFPPHVGVNQTRFMRKMGYTQQRQE